MNDQSAHDVLEDKFRELIAYANNQKGIIEAEKVNTLISELNLDNNQIDKIYERLEAYNVVVLSSSDEEEPTDDILLEMDDDSEDAQSEVEALASSS
jgi:RNA polymerase primary sigma factor